MVKSILSYLKRLFLPVFCISCKNLTQEGNFKSPICELCKKDIKPILSSNIKIKNFTITIHAVSEYKNPLKLLILEKSRSNYLAAIQTAHIIWELSNLKNLEFDYLIPIPLHWTRYAHRGYNQAEVTAKELSKLSKRPVLNCLKRTKKTELQSMLDTENKAKNVAEAFEIRDNIKVDKNMKFMLVDDVMTSGSTIKEAAKILTKLEPATINAIVACKARE